MSEYEPFESQEASTEASDAAANQLPMIARAYGAARQAHEEMLGDCIELGRRGARR